MSKLVLLGAPEGLSITMDFNAWTTGPLFKGIKDIPNGIHYITTNLDQVFGRSGFFIDANSHLNVRQWDDASSRFVQVTDEDQINRISLGMKEIELGLGPYPTELERSWQLHSSHINWKLIKKLCPGNITDTVTSTSRLSEVTDPRLESTAHTIHFTHIDLKHSFPVGSHGEVRSKYSMDKSWLLSKLIAECSENDLIGEMQASFLMFIMGQFYDAFDQWKIMIHMVCNSEQALSEYPTFFVHFLEVLMVQLKECPEDFFRDIISQESFLQDALLSLARNANDSVVAGQLGDTMDRMWTLIYERFQWDIQSQVKMTELHREDDEYAPVVVE